MSSRRSRSGGTWISKPASRCSSGALKWPWRMRSSRLASVAVMSRTSTRTGALPPTGITSLVSSTRSSATCTSGGASPTSSRKSVPPWAARKKPSRSPVAPVYAPLRAPNSSAETSSLERAPRLTLTKGPSRRGLCWWMARATSSLPEPVSPRMSTGTFRSATRTTSSRTRRTPSPWPTMPSSPGPCSAEEDAWCSSTTTRSASSSGTPAASSSGENSRQPTRGCPATRTCVPSSGTSSRTPPRAPGSNCTGLRLMKGSPRGRARRLPGREKSGALRDREAVLPAAAIISLSSRRSPMRWGCGWETMVRAGTVRGACASLPRECTAVVERSSESFFCMGPERGVNSSGSLHRPRPTGVQPGEHTARGQRPSPLTP